MVVSILRRSDMKRARREFLKTTAAGALFGIAGGSRLDAGQLKPAIPMPTERAKALMALFGLKYPIFEAPHGRQTCPDLAIAVSNAGAMGALAGLHDPDDSRGLVSKVRAATKAPFLVNFLLSVVPMWGNEPAALRSVLDAGAPIIHFSWGMPSKEAAAAIRSAGARMGMQVTSAESARAALDLGADYLVCQGTEAGGHVQATRTLYETLPLVLKEAGEKPVVAAGGIGNGQGIREALSAGASAAMLGTRFVATVESNAHPEYKQAIIAAYAKDTALTNCFQDSWPAMHRALRNRTFVMWDAAGCPPPGKRPGEGDVIATIPGGTQFLRYNSRSPLREYSGLVTECALYAGRSVEFVKDLPAAGELVKRLWRECEAAADVSSIGPDKKS
jgi:nitronate monooxygenase